MSCDELTGGTISESLVGVNLVVVGEPRWKLMHHGLSIRSRTDANVVTLDRANEGFSHSIALRTFDWRRSRLKTDVPSEAAGIASDVAAAIVGQPFDRDRQAIDLAEAMLDSRHHQVAHIVAGDATRGGQEAHGLAIAAVECEGNPHSLTAVAADLKAVGAPAPALNRRDDLNAIRRVGHRHGWDR